MAVQPARLAQLIRKGQVAIGSDADLAIFAADETFVVNVKKLKHKNPITPYAGRTLEGVVRKTYLRGVAVDGRTPRGALLRSGSA
jgi:allantoinase